MTSRYALLQVKACREIYTTDIISKKFQGVSVPKNSVNSQNFRGPIKINAKCSALQNQSTNH